MNYLEHVQAARYLLDEADADFAAGKPLKGSEMMAGAAAHAVMAAAQQRGWRFSKHQHRVQAVYRLTGEMASEEDINAILRGFEASKKLHANFYHGNLSDSEIEEDRVQARGFVHRVLAMLN